MHRNNASHSLPPFKSHRLLWLLLLAGLLTRLYGAWALRHDLNLDAGVVTLMARHMALGQDFPVFFYGQPHMGSLEAWFSALFCRLFGISGFAVSLGTAFAAIWLLPIVYKWAADAAGKRAGLMALALIIIGPGGFYHYQVSPRGAYASALTLGAFLVWYATRMTIRWARTHTQSGWDFLILGLAAGLAWWSNQITTAAIITAAILLFASLKRHLFTWRILPGIAGFLFGSAPFWYYNIVNQWASFSFGDTFGRVPFGQALVWLFTDRFPSLILRDNQPLVLRVMAAALYLLLLGYGAFRLWRHRPATNLALTLRGLGIFVVIFCTLFAASHFSAMPTPRYTLPLVAPLAVVIAIMADQLARHVRPAYAWIPLIYLVALQSTSIQWITQFGRQKTIQHESVMRIGRALEAVGGTHLYAPLMRRGWTFALAERILFCELRHNCYTPHEQRLEMRDAASFFENHGNAGQFISDAGGTLQTHDIHGYTLQHSLQPPPLDREEIPPSQWKSATTSEGDDVLLALTDNTLHTRAEWRPAIERQDLLVAFHAPLAIQGLRFTSPDPHNQPGNLLVEGHTPKGEWITLRAEAPLTHLFWSGPRPYWGGPLQRVELRFPPHILDAIRLTSQRDDDRYHSIISALQFFGPAPEQPAEAQALPELLDWLHHHNVQELYADRWLANAVHRETAGRIRTPLDPLIFPREPVLPIEAMTFTAATAIAVRREDAAALQRTLQDRLPVDTGMNVGPWTLFRPQGERPAQPIGLRWTGFGVMRNDADRAAAELARAQSAIAAGTPTLAIQALSEAISLNHTLYHERILLRDLLQQQGHTEAAALVSADIARRTPPPDSFPPIRFANRVVLAGLKLERQPANRLQLTYFWQAPPDLPHEQLAVFVHVLNDRDIIAQDDHVFLSDLPASFLAHQSQTLHLAIPHQITLPPHLDSAHTRIAIGLYDRTNGERIHPRTHLPHHHNATTLPLTIP